MRLIKMFGLAALAAAAVMAFVGASSAMAVTELEEVVVCKLFGEDPCSLTSMHLGAGTILHGELLSGTKAVLLSSTQIECGASTTLGEITELLAHGKITALTFSSCQTSTGVACTVTTEHLNYLVLGLLNAAHNGYEVVVSPEGTNGQPQAEVVCGKIVSCKYGESSVLLTAEPNSSDTVLSVLQELTGVGLLCGTIAHPVWHAKYLTRCLEGVNLVGCWLAMEI